METGCAEEEGGEIEEVVSKKVAVPASGGGVEG